MDTKSQLVDDSSSGPTWQEVVAALLVTFMAILVIVLMIYATVSVKGG